MALLPTAIAFFYCAATHYAYTWVAYRCFFLEELRRGDVTQTRRHRYRTIPPRHQPALIEPKRGHDTVVTLKKDIT
jgi:hypothetical protein